MPSQDRCTDDLLPLLRRDCPDLAARRKNLRPLYDLRTAILVQHRDQRFADCELCKHRFDFQFRILSKRLRGGLYHFLIARSEGAQRVLHPIAQLAKHDVGNVERILANEINANTFRANQSYHLLDLLFDRGRDVGEQQVRFVEKEDQLRFFGVADLGKILE
jgi:hypothetical protein